jgi:deazaflavin-dependent oxidoreductase (nitroreductase family)
VLLSFVEHPRGPVVIASNAGSDRPPAWWRNLQAQPRATIRQAGRTTSVQARELEGAERETAWRAAVAANSGYERYRTETSRRIPIVVLESSVTA